MLPKSDAKASNKNGQTALMYAAQYGNKDLLEPLLSKFDAKATDKQGYTALMYVAFYGTEQMVEVLLPKSDANASNNYDGYTARTLQGLETKRWWSICFPSLMSKHPTRKD